MSLRDWFAGQALAGSLASLINNYNDAKINIVSRESGLTIEQVIAKSCYSWADAMLAARGGVK